MTTPMIETVRNIPLIVEKDTCEPMETENLDTGFPFDRDDRDAHFRSQLDDIAQRHPEFAEHLEGFCGDSLGRRRFPRSSDSEFRRFTDRPFGSSRFERFGFPFTDSFDEEPKKQQKEESKEKTQERGRKPNNIQQSNTVDLGQKQEPVNERNQRSMSAPPPDNRQRYVSSIHIPINKEGGMEGSGQAQSQPQQQQQPQQQNKPTERVIPIHVEGRDEPVIPKNVRPNFTQPQPERVFSQPQPERIFGHSPSHFTQFVNREPRQFATTEPEWHQGYGPEPTHHRFQRQPSPQSKFNQEWQIPVQKETQHQQQHQAQPQQQHPQQQQQQQSQPQPQPAKPSTNPIDVIQSIQKDVSDLMAQVEKFNGKPKDKQYLYLDEMLTRNLIKLDNIDTQGQENIRQARKEAIKCIESCISILEAKAAANASQEQQTVEMKDESKEETNSKETTQTTDEVNQEPQEKMQVEDENKTQTEVKNEEAGKVEEQQLSAKEEEKKMEIVPDEEKVETVPVQQPQENSSEVKAVTEDNKKEEKMEECSFENNASNDQVKDEEMKQVPSEEVKQESAPTSNETPKEENKTEATKTEVKNTNEETNSDQKEKKEKKKVVKK